MNKLLRHRHELDKRRRAATARGRECGECTACCTIMGVVELDKPPLVHCVHVCNGCAIYAQRPKTCQDFECAWRQGALKEEHRPDKLGAMFLPSDEQNFITARETEPGRFDRDDALLTFLRGISANMPVYMMYQDGRRKIIGDEDALKGVMAGKGILEQTDTDGDRFFKVGAVNEL